MLYQNPWATIGSVAMKVIVGLGNPGRKYQKTRHNVGFEVVAELAARHGGGKPKNRFEAEIVDISIGSEKSWLVAPQTFMNNSGRAVRQIADFFDVLPEDILVVCDDLNLETGRLRQRPGGSAGGQKGLLDIIQRLGTESIPRLRIGIGRPPGQMSASDYVLRRFNSGEVEAIEHAIVIAADGIERWVTEGLDAAMNFVNAPRPD